ncbi:lysine--tRNA ligase [Candidatus Woesearchaeota archaeon]|nr:lysine--tRNA ligase [Candidatus Woesearchaeota archaeon]
MSKNEINVKHWADQIADEAIERVESSEFLKRIVKENGYFVYDEKTPSGIIHIGSGRGWIIHDAIAKALRARGKKSRFVLSSDDHDPMDKIPGYLDKKKYEKYMGVPFMDIPSPVTGYKSYGDYYFKQCTELFPQFGIDAELESTGEEYDKGVFNKAIKRILDNTDKVNKIYLDLYGEGATFTNRLPFNVRCPKCGKIATTAALEWDSKKELVYFECRDNVVKWAKGCGNRGWISPYNRNGKLPWKIEWAAKWPSKGVVVETAGKDHFTKGGSRTVACRISVDILEYPPPYPSSGYRTGQGYEFFTVGGKKMSTSKGMGMGFAESVKYAPAQMLRFLLIKSRPNSVIDFQPYESNDLILLYERYDYAERVYFGKEKADEKEKMKQKRIYELSHVGKIPKKMPPQVPFTHAAVIAQIFKTDKEIIQNLKSTEHLPEKMSKPELDYVIERIDFARKWVDEFSPENYKFQLQDKLPEGINLSKDQAEALHLVAKRLKEKKWNEKDLFNEFYKICKEELSINPKEFFKAAYLVLLNKERGPKLAPFILTIKDKAIKLFESVGYNEESKREIVTDKKQEEMEMVSFDEWKRLKMKVGKIINVEKIPRSDKLYKLQVDIGDKKIQLVSSLVPYYKEKDLLNKKIIVLVNLKPSKFGGETSEGMLLCAESDDGKTCVLLAPEKDVEVGTQIT